MTETTTANPTPLTDSEMAAWRTFIEIYSDLVGVIDDDLSRTGLSLGDYQVLVVLSEAEDRSMRMCDLAETLHLTPSGTTRRLDGLVRSGWVERKNSTADRRVMLAVMTDQGWSKLHEALGPHINSVRANFIDLLEVDELEALAAAFGKVRDHLASQ